MALQRRGPGGRLIAYTHPRPFFGFGREMSSGLVSMLPTNLLGESASLGERKARSRYRWRRLGQWLNARFK